MGRARSSLVAFAAAYKRTDDKRYLQYPVDRVLRQCRTVQTSGLLPGYDVIEGILAPAFIRDALTLLGAMADAGFPAIDWPGNMPLVASRPIDGSTWVSQLTVWAQKKAASAGKIRLVFKDTNLTPLEAPGRLRAVILDPSGASNTVTLSRDVSFPRASFRDDAHDHRHERARTWQAGSRYDSAARLASSPHLWLPTRPTMRTS